MACSCIMQILQVENINFHLVEKRRSKAHHPMLEVGDFDIAISVIGNV
jgi:hypothetical protein